MKFSSCNPDREVSPVHRSSLSLKSHDLVSPVEKRCLVILIYYPEPHDRLFTRPMNHVWDYQEPVG